MRRGWMLLDELRNGLRQNILYDIIYPPGHTDPERVSLPPPLPIGVTRPECCGAAGVLLRGNREEAAGPGEEASPPRGRRSRAGGLGIEEQLESDPGSRVTLPGSPREHPPRNQRGGSGGEQSGEGAAWGAGLASDLWGARSARSGHYRHATVLGGDGGLDRLVCRLPALPGVTGAQVLRVRRDRPPRESWWSELPLSEGREADRVTNQGKQGSK
ncbi:hypothetical protein NDU88_002628 [Pleurodeles waltl]|uniref:Uncharacterized protein n=1 Tax=Pleurodeles waltl TaxID=8319 RepID=A0AAV7WR85_PLEWA|nr:hypothetical protein NDU88_002628 [Pleurodeles waltl]